jgi:hypothetical protein
VENGACRAEAIEHVALPQPSRVGSGDQAGWDRTLEQEGLKSQEQAGCGGGEVDAEGGGLVPELVGVGSMFHVKQELQALT